MRPPKKGVTSMSLRLLRSYLCVAVAICPLLLISVPCLSADEAASTPKLYSPFDEPQPKMPAEFAIDKRLDVRISVSVKSKNMKDLFSSLRRLTGVNVVVAKELSAERPIIFYRDKPLREVMIDISNLYGYFWLAKGQKGTWTYELFEDLVHAKRRDQVRDSQEAAMVDGLLEAIDQATRTLESDAALEELHRTNPRLYKTASDPWKRELLKLINLLGKPAIRGCLNDLGFTQDYTDLSSEMQAAVLRTLNADPRYSDDPVPWTADQMRTTRVQFKRWRYSVFSPPHVCLYLTLPSKVGHPGDRNMNGWPGYSDGEPDLLSLPEQPAGRVIGDPLPSDARITLEQTREQLYDGAILVGDVLDAIARQANLDVIADYYFQETSLPPCADELVGKLVSQTCLTMDYTCQVDKDTLRFRFNKWYLQPLPEEPPLSLQEHWWRRITDIGGLSLDDLLDIACLRDKQTYWGGFRFIPQAWQARWFPRTARVVRMLGPAFEDKACTPAGLPVSKLDSDQFARLADWAGVMGVKESPEGLLKYTIRIEKSGDPVNTLQFRLILPDGTPRSVPMTARLERLSEAERRKIAEERATELAADTIELSRTTGD